MSEPAALPDLLLASGVIAPLSAITPDLLYAACEVMIQEGICAWTLPASELDTVRDLLEFFEGRAVVGIRGTVAVGQLPAVLQAGASFVCLSGPCPDVVASGADLGLPILAGALTPTEILDVWEGSPTPLNRLGHMSRRAGFRLNRSRPTAVQVIPADALGTGYTEFLRNELPEVPVVATGRIDSYQTEQWLANGAVAVCPTTGLVSNALSGGVLVGLRLRSRDYASAVERGRATRDSVE